MFCDYYTTCAINLVTLAFIKIKLKTFRFRPQLLNIGYSGSSVKITSPLQSSSPTHRCKRSLTKGSVVTSIGWPFSEWPVAAKCWRGRGGKILKKKRQLNSLYLLAHKNMHAYVVFLEMSRDSKGCSLNIFFYP